MTPILCTRLSGVRGTLTDKLEAAPKLIKPSYRTPARRSRLALPRAIPAGGRGASLPTPLAAEQAADPSSCELSGGCPSGSDRER